MKIPAAIWLLATCGALCGCVQMRDISEVITILEDMAAASKVEAEDERTLYAKFQCYCNKEGATKANEIKALEETIATATSELAQLRGQETQLTLESKKLLQDIADLEAATSELSQIRTTDQSTYDQDKQELEDGIALLGQAITALEAVDGNQVGMSSADHQRYAAMAREDEVKREIANSEKLIGSRSWNQNAEFLQATTAKPKSPPLALPQETETEKVKSTIKAALLASSLFTKPQQQNDIRSFLQASAPWGSRGTYTAQSVEIVGTLTNMKDSMQSQLDRLKSKEEAEGDTYTSVAAENNNRKAIMEDLYNEKQQLLSGVFSSIASKMQILKQSKEELAETQTLSTQLEAQCAEKKKEYETRVMLRANEEASIYQAIKLLGSDEAFTRFQKVSSTSAASFFQADLQIDTAHHRVHRELQDLAHNLLKKGLPVHKVMLTKIATMLQSRLSGDPFQKVLMEIAKMTDVIDAEQKADDEQHAWCEAERTASDATIAEKGDEISAKAVRLEELRQSIEGSIAGNKEQVERLEEQMKSNLENQKEATTNRDAERALYQTNSANLVKTEEILTKALETLKMHYSATALLAVKSVSAHSFKNGQTLGQPAPPATWTGAYEGQKTEGNRATQLLNTILENVKTEKTQADSAEAEAERLYESAMTALKGSYAQSEEALATAKVGLAEEKEEYSETQKAITAATAEKSKAEDYKLSIKPGCDFITEHLAYRTAGRKEEKEALADVLVALQSSPAFQAQASDPRTWDMCPMDKMQAAMGVMTTGCQQRIMQMLGGLQQQPPVIPKLAPACDCIVQIKEDIASAFNTCTLYPGAPASVYQTWQMCSTNSIPEGWL